MARLVALLSGGVDSAVAAALAIDQGHEVVGITMKQWSTDGEETRVTKGCSVTDAVADSARVCDVLGIDHYAMNFTQEFELQVIQPFVESYARGETPNPCIACNSKVRFGSMLHSAMQLGFDGVITGHWAQSKISDDRNRLYRANNKNKDQSYVLHRLTQDSLAKIHWPLGSATNKQWARDFAQQRGLKNFDRADSTDVCFIGETANYRDLLTTRAPETKRPGPILTLERREIGTHSGTSNYTIGQRKGLGISSTQPQYVVSIEGDSVIVGPSEELSNTHLKATDPSWIVDQPSDGETVTACVRYRATPANCIFTNTPKGFELNFETPVRAAANGQAVVLYKGDEVVGGGVISEAS